MIISFILILVKNPVATIWYYVLIRHPKTIGGNVTSAPGVTHVIKRVMDSTVEPPSASQVVEFILEIIREAQYVVPQGEQQTIVAVSGWWLNDEVLADIRILLTKQQRFPDVVISDLEYTEDSVCGGSSVWVTVTF